ncbi:MAG: hypothetical protein EOO11_16725 [Chitinophagaceae bacterium]|nr:MAG: hypothetical protein EOO11_16725 [Chitinophagaceae bacterium]
MKKWILPACCAALLACTGSADTAAPAGVAATASSALTEAPEAAADGPRSGRWEGVFTNGMKETYLSFVVSKDGRQLRDLTFKGYWYCGSHLTQEGGIGPLQHFTITGNKVDGVIVDSTSYTRFELHGTFNGNQAQGTYRMSITGLGCDTRVLTWTARRK